MHRSTNSIQAINEDEQFLYEIHRHPIGLIIVYVQVIIGFIALMALFYFLAPQVLTDLTDQQRNSKIAVIGMLFAILFWLALMIYTYIYRQNKLILTDKNLTQVIQLGLFHHQVSELSMANVEDVTALKRGILSTFFDFGQLKVETAGEQNNFDFKFCPKPDFYGKVVLDQRQKYIERDLAH